MKQDALSRKNKVNPLVPTIFHEQWWLDITTDGLYEIVEVAKGGKTVGRLPYFLRSKYGVKYSFLPNMTHFLGPAIDAGERCLGSERTRTCDIANADLVEPGTVMVLGHDGLLQPSQSAYDKRVAGVVSGAGNYKPGIVLDKQGSQPNRKPIALLGKVYCQVDAGYAPVEIGDLLTTSPTLGHGHEGQRSNKSVRKRDRQGIATVGVRAG